MCDFSVRNVGLELRRRPHSICRHWAYILACNTILSSSSSSEMDKMMVGCVAGGQSARVPTSHTPGSHLFPLANDVDDYADFMRYVNSITNVLPTHHATTTTVVIVVALRRRRSKIFLKILLRSGPEHDFFLAFQTEIVNVITNVLLTLNSAVNFLIYCLLGKKFRRIFTDMFCAWMPCYRRRRRASSVDHSDIKLVTNRRTSNLPSRVVSGEDGQQPSSRRWSLTPKNKPLLEVPATGHISKEPSYRSAPSLLMTPPQSQPSSPCRIDVHV